MQNQMETLLFGPHRLVRAFLPGVRERRALPEDYAGSVVSEVIEYLHKGTFVADGDKNKAAKIICKIVLGEGVGAWPQEERFFNLGRRVIPHARMVRDQLGHTLLVVGEVVGNVYIDQQ
ncbi:Short-chain dehydrogenase/reductase SDR [Penicillium antarcticum]|uniref:Short-chain dehydrogenase/reductase SDR n=1 Tax=Penicillium antarcticum TaxID=416450 RepID=UPI002384DCD3|nr:Short-chain dehydrogenase/reductase SDR [Penicillium antarcticum]KAJ5294131.1 Short-chain dehydrogenase/reductase SDR [Penicillium antarcticum]